MLQVLPEVISSEELLARVALAELVNFLQVSQSEVPVLLGGLPGASCNAAAGEFVAAETANISLAWTIGALVESRGVAMIQQS